MSNWNNALAAMPPPGSDAAMVSGRADVIERLPVPAGAKLRRMREELEGLRVVERATREKLDEAVAAKHSAEGRIRQLREDLRVLEGGDDHPAMQQALGDLKRAADEVEYRQELIARHSERSRLLGGLLNNNLVPYLRQLPTGALEPGKPTATALRKGERPENGLKRLRIEIDDLRDAIQQVRRAPLPSAEAKALVRVQLEEMRRRSAPDVLALVERGDAVQFPTAPVTLPLVAVAMAEGAPTIRGDARGEIADATGLLAWLFPDQLQVRLEAEIDARSDDDAALSDDERDARERELRARLLHAERLEEAVICQLEGAGVACPRRLDADARAVLGIIGPAPGGE